MELEQRVKTLEYEIKILKNEVQRTLLDIQEQVLIHYYPTLRMEETKPSEGTVLTIEQLRARNPAPAAPAVPPAAPPAPSVPPAAPAVASVEAAAPMVKKVSLEEIRQAQKELATEDAPSNAAVNKLVEWAKKPEAVPHGNGDGNIPFMRRAEDKPKAVSYGSSNDNGSGSGNGNGDDNGYGDAQPASAHSTLKLLEWVLNTASKVNGAENDGVSADMLGQLTKLNALVDRAGGVEEALRLLEEAKVG